MRSDKHFIRQDGSIDKNGLGDAIKWFKDNDIPLYGAN
jgi:hypothetical protein